MPDFAKIGAKRLAPKRSAFTSFREQQKFHANFLVFKKIFWSLILVMLCFVISLAVVSYVFLRVSRWQQKNPIGIVFLTSPKDQVLKQTTLLWVNPEKNEINLMDFPGDLSVHTSGSVVYSLKALYGLSAINHLTPADFLKVLVRNIRVDVPYFIVREGQPLPTQTNLRKISLGLLLANSSPSAFPFADRFALFWYVWFSGVKVNKLEFPNSVATSTLGFDDLDYDVFVQKHFLNLELKKEGLSVALVNASAQSKLASTCGRLFTGLGLNVLSVSDTPNTQDEGTIYVNSGHLIDTGTVNMLHRYISGAIKVDTTITNEYRSDVVIFLGKNEAVNFRP